MPPIVGNSCSIPVEVPVFTQSFHNYELCWEEDYSPELVLSGSVADLGSLIPDPKPIFLRAY
jgi:hypothetical protein